MMPRMSPIAPRDALESGFSPSLTPPRAADGGLELEPAPVRLPVIQPKSLCELGPCRNLHVIVQKLDAERPLDGSPAPIHVTTSHTCYPSPGIEYDLTSEPVKECNRWDPTVHDDESARSDRRRDDFMWGDVTMGKGFGRAHDEYKAFLASWGPPALADEPPK